MNHALVDELRLSRQRVTALVEPLDDTELRTRYHPRLSPLGWHLGHCTWVESYWLQQVLAGNSDITQALAQLYNPAESPRETRGERLPEATDLRSWVTQTQALSDRLLLAQSGALAEHALLQDDYLLHFLIQHYSQHYETMQMSLLQRALCTHDAEFPDATPLMPVPPSAEHVEIEAGHYRVGGVQPIAYDNELPAQHTTLESFRIATHPVSNGNYLSFMQDKGYSNRTHWTDDGWHWLQQHGHDAPDHWQRDGDGHWYGMVPRGPCTLAADDAVYGLSWFEADAYARWANARLPHEHQWEVASRMQRLQDSGCAWEWCSNTLYPYAGFEPFPYDEYSTPWFDGKHYCLRGGSQFTRPSIRRPSFRNFYTPETRHVFAGLRLAYDSEGGAAP